ncbi:Serine/threonine-protein kinase TIO [Senna tora]|uniref:Serine/threonine-protein kinase TIO n=1 Tax=Senna tora TaxID=362788 RepID=A0A834TVM9_9FABA|nr:Serine/threonine-protein kinase TIO [Senna tora]
MGNKKAFVFAERVSNAFIRDQIALHASEAARNILEEPEIRLDPEVAKQRHKWSTTPDHDCNAGSRLIENPSRCIICGSYNLHISVEGAAPDNSCNLNELWAVVTIVAMIHDGGGRVVLAKGDMDPVNTRSSLINSSSLPLELRAPAATSTNQNILRLHVTVDDTVGMQVMNNIPIALQLPELVLQEGTYHPQESQIVHPGY